jgi:hypothetical protein
MRTRCLAYTIAAFQLLQWSAAHAQFVEVTLGPNDRSGLHTVSTKPYPVPADSKPVPMDGGDFETPGTFPAGWSQGGGEVIAATDAPQGKAYFSMKAKKGSALRSPVVTAQPGVPYFLSFWVKSKQEPWASVNFTSDEREPSYTNITNFSCPAIDEWRNVGLYFIMPAQCKTMQFDISVRNDGEFMCIDDVQFRTASDAEFTQASQAERANWPAYDVTPHPGDGKNLALMVAKLEGKAGLPGKPFVVWAIGSSFTDRLGDGHQLIEYIHEHFPHAPTIVYRKHGGPGAPWYYCYTWMRQFIDYEQPDLVFSYTSGEKGGATDDLDKLLHEIRSHTTADIIIPTLHLHPEDDTPDGIVKGMLGIPWTSLQPICDKHYAEFVNNRQELADYIHANKIVPDDLLVDHNHENEYGSIRIWDNVTRHIVESAQAAYKPEALERTVSVAPPANTATEQVTLTGAWKQGAGSITSSAAGDKLKIAFTGNKLYLIGQSSPTGGSVKVAVDGVPGDQAPVFITNYIEPTPRNWRIPHLANLGSNIVPQKWTIAMTSDTGDFSVTGSVTGPDGAGNLEKPFTSTSGQIILDPHDWRQGRVNPARPPTFPEYAVKTGDTFTFDVMRATQSEVSFKADTAGQLVQQLVQNLPNGPHTVEITTTGGDVAINSLYVFQPPEKD